MHCKSKIEYYGQSAGLLSWTSDMECWSFSLPAGKDGACPMSVYGNNSICGSCYASVNRYNMPNVLTAQWIRFLWAKSLLETEVGQIQFETIMTNAIDRHVKNNYFRFFDSGDIFSPQMAMSLYKICLALPHIKFWFPTRSWQAVNANWIQPMANLASLPNVTVRPSTLFFNKLPPKVSNLSAGTTVITKLGILNLPQYKNISLCPKTINGGSCESNNCRSCWENDTEIAYLVHGIMGQNKPATITDRIINLRSKIKQEVVGLSINGVPV